MKKIMIATLLSAVVSASVFADNSNDLADAGLIFEMDNSQSVELALLSSEEMKNTEGALAPWIIGGGVGALAGGGGYIYGWYDNKYTWNTSKFLGNAATGALAGATFGAAGSLAGGGLSVGANIWRANSFSFNLGANQAWRR
ncbi:MAG: hypothetical protein RL217_173 [Pseudomonadota bacterium]|jgi:hypothetical protein